MNSPNVEMGVAITSAEGSVGSDKIKIETFMNNFLSTFFTISAFYNPIFWKILLCFIYFSVTTRVSLKFAFSPCSIPNEFATKRLQDFRIHTYFKNAIQDLPEEKNHLVACPVQRNTCPSNLINFGTEALLIKILIKLFNV
jgi:hypothetical protein